MNSKPVRILLVEDNPGDARLIREMLAQAVGGEFAVEWVPNLSDGLRRLSRKEIDLVLLDLGLPDSQGLDTFVRACAQAPQVPIVVLSGLADETLAVTAVRQGAQDYLIKGEVDSPGLGRAIRYATERKQAEEALKESAQKLRYLTSRLFTAQEDERKRISRELHDEMGQALLVLKLQLQSLGRKLGASLKGARADYEEMLAGLDQVVEKVRRLSRDLSPSILEDLGLSAALRHQINEFRKHYHLEQCRVEIDDLDGLFPEKAQTNIFRILQECLTNIGKYAHATSLAICIKRAGGQVAFQVEDNGRGFDVTQAWRRLPPDRGLGLAAMEERVRMLGGSLSIGSQEGKGTKLSFTIPVPEEAAEPHCLGASRRSCF